MMGAWPSGERGPGVVLTARGMGAGGGIRLLEKPRQVGRGTSRAVGMANRPALARDAPGWHQSGQRSLQENGGEGTGGHRRSNSGGVGMVVCRAG